MDSLAQSMPAAFPEVGITPTLADVGYTHLVGLRQFGRVRLYWSAGPTLDPQRPYEPLVHIRIHSETPNWGYSGAGCQDLAYSVLLAVAGRGVVAQALYHQFCHDVIHRLPHEGFALSVRDIRNWLVEHERQVA